MVGAEAADRQARGLGYLDGLAVLASGVKLARAQKPVK